MKLILHHFLKSVRTLRWILALWLLIVATQAVTTILSVQPDYHVARVAEMIGSSPFWSFLNGMIWLVAIVGVIQSEPVTGATSFWLTRPIPPFISVPSKAIFILGLVVLLSLVPKTTDLFLFGVPFHAIQDALEGIIFLQLFIVVCVVWLATYTRNFGQFAGVIAVLFVLFATYSMTLAFSGGAFTSVDTSRPELFASRMAVAFLTFLGGLAVSLIMQYFFHAIRKAFLIGLGSILSSIAFLFWWPFVLPTLWHGHPSPAAPKSVSLAYQLDPMKPFAWGTTQLMNINYQTAKVPLVSPPPTPKGIPFLRAIESTFQPDEDKKTSLPTSFETYAAFTPDHLDWLTQLRQNNSGLVIEGETAPSNEPVPAFMLTPELAGKFKNQKGTLDFHITGDVVSLQKRAEIPLGGNGFVRIPQALIRVIAIQKEKDNLELTVEEAGYRNVLKWQSLPTVYLLVDPRTRTGIIPKRMPMRSQRGGFDGELGRMSTQITLRVQTNDLPENLRANFQGDAVNGLVLHVYEVTPIDSFESDVKDSEYTFHPGER